MRRRAILCLIPVIAVTALTGCRKDQFRANPTPGITNMAWTNDEIANRLTITNDTNLRTLSNDLGRALLLDKPSELRPGPPVPYGH
jgi:hypothetical protein